MPRDYPFTITIDPNDPESVRRALNTEWLLTNGLGGYAMGTALGVNTRRYHGLLVAATKPPVGRIVTLHSMIEQLIIPRDDGTEEGIDLSTQQFVAAEGELVLHPDGWRHLRSLSQNANGVVWEWRFGETSVYKSVAFLPGKNRCVTSFLVKGAQQSCRLRVRPFILLRDFHSLRLKAKMPTVTLSGQSLNIEDDDCRFCVDIITPAAWQGPTAIDWTHDEESWNQFAYNLDRQRGQDWIESVWSPGFAEAIAPKEHRNYWGFSLRSSLLKPLLNDPNAVDRWLGYYTPTESTQTNVARLKWAAKDYVVTRTLQSLNTSSVIAGYPWFGDWGRDTMIALPGLMLCTGRFEEARSTLLTFAQHLYNGLIPNLFDDYGHGAHYNAVDASLWFVHAVHELSMAPRNSAPGRSPGLMVLDAGGELTRACRAIINAYRNGTDFNIRMDDDGLITAGDETTQLTWMDAKRDGVVFTPRHGKAVEFNALWFNALCCMMEMTDDDRERSDLRALSRKAAESFRDQFWWNDHQCLYDVLGNSQIRPNQIFAVSLPFSPLDDEQKRAVVKIVGDRLLTPFGLRTLDRDDPNYRGRYEGNLFERDRAYHNGTVWPWLIGPYCEALLRINDFSAASKEEVRQIIQPLIDEMTNTEGGRCLGQIAEVYDGDEPQRPGGCPAQAWSVAEVLRIASMLE